jgi:hypothetical protein
MVAARNLAYIAANVSLPRLDGTVTPAVQGRVREDHWIKAGIASLPPGDDFDIYAAVRDMGWQPQNHIPAANGRDAGAISDNMAKLAELRHRAEAPVTDGIAPMALVNEYTQRHTASWETDKQRSYAIAEAQASVGRIVTGRMADVVQFINQPRMAKVTALWDSVGANPGSMRLAHVGARGTMKCMACDDRPTNRWWVNFDNSARSKEFLAKVLTRRMRREPATAGPDLEQPSPEKAKPNDAGEYPYKKTYPPSPHGDRDQRMERRNSVQLLFHT